MIPVMLLAFSMIALAQFGLYYWRAVLAEVAAQPLSEHIRQAAAVAGASLGAADFDAVLGLHELTRGLKNDVDGLRLVRAYYSAVKALGRLAQYGLPPVTAWADREMATCTRYVTVLLDQRLARNLACATEVRSC